jgi:hypothetical protein
MLFAVGSLAQEELDRDSRLYQLESQLIAGDKNALLRLGDYFDSPKKVVDFLGYHRIETTEASVAKRMVQENTTFTYGEITITEATSKKEFLTFLTKNFARITYSKELGVFLATPPEARLVEFELVELSPKKKAEAASKIDEWLRLNWVKEAGIDRLIEAKDPRALLEIADHLFRTRSRWNRYYFQAGDDIGLLQYLTGTTVVVKNANGEFTHHIEGDYDPTSRLNLLIFFAKHHKSFKFDEAKGVFLNPALQVKAESKERILFEGLYGADDAAAFDAFTKLTELDPAIVEKLSVEYRALEPSRRPNSKLPTFPFNFLTQLSRLTDHCKKVGADCRGSDAIRSRIGELQKDLPFGERYRLENKVIADLSLDETTPFEYWALVYSGDSNVTFSAGRILDKAYTRHWNALTADKKRLELYLKKAALFDELGIIGIVNGRYLDKFIGASPATLALLRELNTNDKDVAEQAAKALALKPRAPAVVTAEKAPVPPPNLEDRLKYFAAMPALGEEETTELVKLLSDISYKQIGIALGYLERINVEESRAYIKYQFLDRDWGLQLAGDFDDESVRKDFFQNYSKLSQIQLYAYYLDKNGFEYRKPTGALDFDKIYEMLEYDLVEALAGGGGGRREPHVYPLIKLLEQNFGTTLGFMNKLCVSNGSRSCSSHDRALAWMTYLRENRHVRQPQDKPLSFTYRGR